MKKRVFIGILAAFIFSMNCSVFAAPAAAFGDSSKGNHPLAPYAESDIIVPRPAESVYDTPAKYQYTKVPYDVKGHWAEGYLTYFIQSGAMNGNTPAFEPNKAITYAEFAQTVSRLGLEPAEFNGGSVSYKVFSDFALWNPDHPDSKAGYICAEAGVWGNPSEATDTLLGYPGFRLGDQAQRQYIASFLVNMLPQAEGDKAYGAQFTDINQCSSVMCKEAMARLAEEKIISGYTDGTIRPKAPVTKAELAVMLYKVMGKSQFDTDVLSNNLYGNYHDYYWVEEGKLLTLVNEERRKNGLRALEYDMDLNALCEIKMLEKSIYGMDTFTHPIQYDGKTVAAGHVSQFYGRCTEMAKTFGLNRYRVGENAVQNASNAVKAHNRLTDSQAHRANYLNTSYEIAGFAVGTKATYQMFAYLK